MHTKSLYGAASDDDASASNAQLTAMIDIETNGDDWVDAFVCVKYTSVCAICVQAYRAEWLVDEARGMVRSFE